MMRARGSIAFLLVASTILVATTTAAYAALRPPLTWEAVLKKIRRAFPDAPGLDLAGLDRLARSHALIFVDTRSDEEFAVSRIPGASHIAHPSQEDVAYLRSLAAGTPRPAAYVFYCSVGYRSAKATEKARALGLDNAFNFEGSIFAWANAGRPLEKPDGGPATRVHPFDARWGQLLDEALRADR